MAKNVFNQKKKRIAHFQNAIDNFTEGGGENDGCLDYVSSIIQSMDSNFDTLHSDYVEKYSKNMKRKVTRAQQKDSNSTSFSSTDFSQNPMRLKGKLPASRKFPLMEKSQKIMKQLKHNRRIPKPRAHMAALPKSPAKVDITVKPNTSKKKKLKDKSKMSNSSFSSARVSDNNALNSRNVNNKDSKISNQKSVCKKGEINESKNLCEDSVSPDVCRSDVTTDIKKNSLSDTKALKESENETTDSEYERFVKTTKKGLPKKTIKKQKLSAKSKASCDKSKSRVRKKTRKKYDSDDDDGIPLSSSSKKMSSFKKQKIAHKVPMDIDTENISNGSESDVVVNDIGIKDSSSVSDTVNNETSEAHGTLASDEENVCSELHEADSSCESDATLPDISSLMNKGNLSEVVDNVVTKDDILDAFSTHFKGSSDLDKTELNDHTPDLIDLCDSEDDCKSSEYSTVSASVEQKRSAIDSTFGLHDNNKEVLLRTPEKCKLMDAAQNIHPDSEESDLEVIEVITNCSKNRECETDKPPNVPNQFKSIAHFKENDINVGGTHSQGIVKTENLLNAHVCKAEHIIKKENPATDDSKHDAVYMTNICNELSQDKLISQRTLSCEHSKSLEKSSKDGLLDDDDDIVILNPVQNLTEMPHKRACCISSGEKMKTEMPVDFIDSLKHVKNSTHEFLKRETELSFQPQSHVGHPTVINTNFESKHLYTNLQNRCPVECVDSKIMKTQLTEKELKIYEGMCSNSRSLPLNSSGVVWEGNQEINKYGLIELYKKEFKTYQEIVQTEASVGASLKLLETRQAERVKFIRSLVQKYVETSNSSDASQTGKGQLSTFETLTDGKPSVSSLINLTGGTGSNMSQIKASFGKEEFLQDLPSSVISSVTNDSKLDNDFKPIIYSLTELQNSQMLQQSTVIPKSETELSQEYQNSRQCQSDEKQTLKLLKEKCNVCGKEAVAACQGCAKVFFCSHECGMKFWNEGHAYYCGK